MSEVYKATENKIKINTTSDSDVYKATKNAQITDTEAYKKTLGNKIQQDIASKINYRFTPTPGDLKGDVVRAKMETENAEKLRTTIPSRTYNEQIAQQKSNIISPQDRTILSSAKNKILSKQPLNQFEYKTIEKYGLRDFADGSAQEVMDLISNSNPVWKFYDDKFVELNDKAKRGERLSADEEELLKTAVLIRDKRKGVVSNFTKLSSNPTENKENQYILEGAKIYDATAYGGTSSDIFGQKRIVADSDLVRDEKEKKFSKNLKRDIDRGLLYAGTGLTNYLVNTIDTGITAAGYITGNSEKVKKELAERPASPYEMASQSLREFYIKNGDEANKIVQDVVTNIAQNAIPLTLSMLGSNIAYTNAVKTGATINAANKLSGTVGRIISTSTFAPSVFGNAYKEGVKSGITEDWRLLSYATAVTVAECTLEMALGAEFAGSGVLSGKAIENLSKNFNKVLVKVALKATGNSVSEYVEESIQSLLGPLLKEWLLGTEEKTIFDDPLGALSDAAYDGFIGFVSSLFMSGYSSLQEAKIESGVQGIGKVYNDIMQQTNVDVKNVAEFFKEIANGKEGNELRKKAEKVIKGDTSDLSVGELINEATRYSDGSVKVLYAHIGQNISIVENGVKTLLSTYEDIVESGSVYPEEVSNLYQQVKTIFENGDIDNAKLGEFAYYMEAYSPRAHILGEVSKRIQENPKTASQSVTTTENEVESGVVPVEQSGEVLETPVVSQQERETVFTEPTNQEIYRDPTPQENEEAMFGTRKNAKQRHILDVAKKLDSNMKVVFVNKNSKTLNNKNGKYNRNTNTMYIAKDLTAVEMYAEVFKHEFIHRLESRKAYQSFKNYLFKKSEAFEAYANARLYYPNKLDIERTRDEAINGLIDMYVENTKGDLNLTREQAEREAVADFVARTLFKDKNANFIQAIKDKNIKDDEGGIGFAQMESDLALFEEMAKTDRNLFQKIIDAIRDLIASIKGMPNLEKDLKYLEERLARVYESADNTKNRSNLNNEVFDIAVLENGNTYVKASRKIITGTTLKEQRAQITDFFKKLLKNKPSIDIPTIEGDILTITMEDTEDKARDNYKLVDGKPVKMSNEEFAVKLRVESHIDEIAETAIKENKPLTPDDKEPEVAKDGFEYRTAYFEDFDGSYYKIRFSVGHNGTIATVYNVGKIKEDVPSSAKLIAVVGSQALDSPSSTDIIRNKNDFVNNDLSNESFSSDNLDTDYLKAVENNDMETAQRLVDEAAKEAGYDSPILYHGTRSFGFTQFDLEKMDDKRSIFLTNNKKIASTYSGVTGARNISSSKEVAALSPQDLVNEFNAYEEQFGNDTTEGKGEYQLYNFEKFNKLLNNVNSGIEDLTKKVNEQIKIYADKMAIDFDEKDSKIHSQLVKLSESLKKYDYDNLSTPIYMLLHYSEVFDRSPEIAKLESNIRLMNKLKNMDLSEGVIASEYLGGYDIEVMSLDTARMKLENKYKQGNMSLVAKLGKSLVIDGKNQNWNDIRNWQESAYHKRDNVEVKKVGDEYILYDKTTKTKIQNGTLAVNSFTKELSEAQLITHMLDNANYSLRILTEGLFNTREISGWAKANGYDSVTIKNIRDNGGWNAEVGYDETADIYIIFNPNNVKSADPVTYDDNGNVIPLSERFNDENVDIRYSSDDLSTLQRNLYNRHKNGELTNEEYLEETDKLWGKANETYGMLPQGENAKAPIATPKAVAEDKPTERFTRTIVETDTLKAEMLQGMEEKVLLGDFAYDVISDESAIKIANKAIENQTANTIWGDVVSDGKRINKNKIAIGEQLLANAIKDGKTFEVLKLSAELADIFTRAGQVVQAARLLKKMTGAGRLVSAQRTIKTINNDLRAKYGEDFPPVKISPESAKRLAEAKTAGGIEYAYQEIMQEVAAQVPVTFMDKWNAWRYFAMLSNPKTHIRNLVGNGIFVPAVVIKDALAVGMETAFVKDSSKKTKSILVKKEYRDFAKKDAKLDSVKNLLKGNKYNDKSAIREKQKVFKSEALNFLTEFNSNALEAEDMLFKNIHYIHALAGFLQARNVNLKNVSQEVLEEARIYAVKEAKKATFNDESALANAIQRFGNKNLGTSILVEGVLPFKRTPINIIKRGIEYSPIGLIKTATKGLYDVKKGKISLTECIDGFVSGLTGTGLLALGMVLSGLGAITGGEDDDDKSQFEKWLGKQEYAVEIGGKSYTVDWAAPANIPFFIGVEIANIGRNEEDFTFANVFNTMWNALEPITNLSMLSGIQGVIESARYAEPSQVISSIAVDALTSYGMQGVPSLFGAAARTIDPTQRSWYTDKNDKWLDSTAQTIKNNIQSKIPGLSYTQIPKIDMWGREVSRGGTAERVLENFVSPGYYSEIEVTETSEELKRIFKETDQDVFPNIAAKSFKVGSETKHLTAQEYVTYAKAKGSYSYEYIKEFMETTAYKKLTDKEKADVITKLYEYANAKAKAIVSDYDLMKNYKTVTQWEQNGRSAIDYYIFRAINK